MKKISLSILIAFLMALFALPAPMADEDEFQKDMAKMHETLAKNAEKIAKDMKQKQHGLHKKIEAMHKQIEKMMPQIEGHMKHSIALLDQMDIDIEIPDIEIPDIDINLPDIPSLPKMKNFGKDFKGEMVSETVEKSFEVSRRTPLKVDSQFSTARIETGDNNSKIEIRVEKKAGAENKELAQELLDCIEIYLEKKQDTVEVKVALNKDKQKDLKLKNSTMHSEIYITVPPSTPVRTKNSFGDTLITGVKMGIHTENKFGNTILTDTEGELYASSEYGKLHTKDHAGDSEIRGQFGDVTIENLKGDIKINVGYGKSFITSLSEEAKIDGKFSFGALHLALPTGYSGTIEAAASFGEIRAPKNMPVKKKMFNESLNSELGSGEGQVRIKASYSPVHISLGGRISKEARR